MKRCLIALIVVLVLTLAGCGGGGGDSGGGDENSAPVSNAGSAQNVVTGALVTLDGNGSSDVDGDLLSYSWAFTAKPNGSNTTLSSTTNAKPTFIPDLAGAYVINLVVNDGVINSAVATVTVTATNSTALTSIAVTPANASVAYGLTQQFIATGQYTDGTSAILSADITWGSVDVCSLGSLNAYTPIAVNSILLGSLSPLSPAAKMDEARTQFNDIGSRAKLGDANAIAKLQDISTVFLTISRAYNATGAAFVADFTTVENALVETTSLGSRDIAAATANACGLASLRKFTSSLIHSNLSIYNPETQVTEARAQFNDISSRAKLGDTEANWRVNSLAIEFLALSNSWYGGGSGYVTDFNMVQQTLSEIQSLVLPITPAAIASNNGLATGDAVGTSIITATSGGISGTTTLTITAP